jgi:hypothetical protein
MAFAEPVGWIAQFAAQTGLRYEADADERWMRAWEPYTTLKIALGYAHVLHATGEGGSISIARMTVTSDRVHGGEARCWVAIAQDPRLTGRGATTSDMGGIFGEPMDLSPTPRQLTGDRAFDAVFASYSPSAHELETALTPSLRKLLLGWGSPVHAEVRPGGFVLAPVALAADATSLAWLLDAARAFGNKASKQRRQHGT